LPKWAGAVKEAGQSVREALVKQNLPGLSVAVGVNGELVWAEGFGWANMENRVPVAPDTPFRIGTASKLLTSAAVGLLLEQGRLKLDEEIQTYVPRFPKKQWPVTLRQVMGHLAGIRGDGGDEENLRERCEHAVDGLKRFGDADLRREPGTEYYYSSYGWILVSAAVEAVADEPFFTFMRRQVFEPLGMDDTKSDSGKLPIPNQALVYFPRFAADPFYGPQEPSEVDFSCLSGASAFLSTPSDIVRFFVGINSRSRQGSGAQGGGLLKPATVELLQTSQRTASGAETGYGLGWDLETVPMAGQSTRVIGYGGELMGGPVSSFVMFPDQGIIVAVISNSPFANTTSLTVRLAEIFSAQGK
jgi:CubicO group peptidase (beta-lactamase class C family)